MAKSVQPSPAAVYSFHGFILPFEWKHRHSDKKLLDEQTDLAASGGYFLADKRWSRVSYNHKPAAKAAYNEAVYFYDFVRPALYDNGSKEPLLYHYRFEVKKDTFYLINKGQYRYRLRISSIEMRLYRMGVGVLVFQMTNEQADQADPEDILRINQYGRRLFPPFYNIAHPSAGAPEYFAEDSWEQGLTDHPELPDSLALVQDGREVWQEDYSVYKRQPALNRPPGLLHFLLPVAFREAMRLTPVLDDRMFVVCWYGNDKLAGSVRKNYPENDWWYRFLFVDIGRTVQNKAMMASLLEDHSYLRWSDWGTAFGIARYSLVCLTGAQVPAFLVAHMRTLYLRMAELALLQRACVLRFSEEVTSISSIDTRDRSLAPRMASLFRQYLRFVNQLSFKEVTAQEQGIEMYDLLRRSMRLDEQVANLETEIRELHNYAETLAEQDRSEKLDLLTYLGAYLAVPGFIASYYAGIDYSMTAGLHWMVMIALFGGYALLVWLMLRLSGHNRVLVGLLILAFVFFALFGVPHFFK